MGVLNREASLRGYFFLATVILSCSSVPQSLAEPQRELVYVSNGKIRDLLGCDWNGPCRPVEPVENAKLWRHSDEALNDPRYQRWLETLYKASTYYSLEWSSSRGSYSRRDLQYKGRKRQLDTSDLWKFSGLEFQAYRGDVDTRLILRARDPRTDKIQRAYRIPVATGRLEQELVPMFATPELPPSTYLDQAQTLRRSRSTSSEDIALAEYRYFSNTEIEEVLGISWRSDRSVIENSKLLRGFRQQTPLRFFAGNNAEWYTPNWHTEVEAAHRSGPTWTTDRDSESQYFVYLRSDNERLVILRFHNTNRDLRSIYMYYTIPGATALRVLQPSEQRIRRTVALPEHCGSVSWGDSPRMPGEWEGHRQLQDPGEFFRTYGAAFKTWKEQAREKPHSADQSWEGPDETRYYLFATKEIPGKPSPAFHILGYSKGQLSILFDYDEAWTETIYRPLSGYPNSAIAEKSPVSTDSPAETLESASIPDGLITIGDLTIPLPGRLLVTVSLLLLALIALLISVRIIRKVRLSRSKRAAIHEAKHYAEAAERPPFERSQRPR